MAGISVPVVLIPRFTTYVGAADFLSYALDVSAYDTLRLTAWRAPLIGTSPTFGLSTYRSLDRVTWEECAGPQDQDPGDRTEVLYGAACQDILDSMYEISTRATLPPLARGR